MSPASRAFPGTPAPALPARRGPRLRPLVAAAALLALFGASRPAHAWKLSDDLEVYGYLQGWLTLYEQMEDARGLFQYPSGDEAADATTGFRLNRVRVGLDAAFFQRRLRVALLLRLEEDVGVLDAYVAYAPWRWLELRAGQFRVPSTAENLTPDRRLDFTYRTMLSDTLADYALSRTRYASSLFVGNRSFRRDAGVGLTLDGHRYRVPLKLFFMVGNGLGANLFISGNQPRGFLITNKGQLFYAARLQSEPVPGWLRLGVFGSYNRHDNVVFNSGRVVFDLYRMATAGDLELTIPPAGLRLGVLGGYGVILEDANEDGRKDYRYGGVAAWVLWTLTPMLSRVTGGRYPPSHHVYLGARYEKLWTEADEAGIWTTDQHVTALVGYRFRWHFKIQFEAVWRITHRPFYPDLDDDLYLLSFHTEI